MLKNGALLAVAAGAGYDAFVTGDKKMQHQQNLSGQPFGILVLSTTRWTVVRSRFQSIDDALRRLQPGDVRELTLE